MESRQAGLRNWRTVSATWSSPSALVLTSDSVRYYRVRAYGGGATYAAAWSQLSEVVTLLPSDAFNFSPSPLVLGGMSDVWTVPEGVSSVYLNVDFSLVGAKDAGADHNTAEGRRSLVLGPLDTL